MTQKKLSNAGYKSLVVNKNHLLYTFIYYFSYNYNFQPPYGLPVDDTADFLCSQSGLRTARRFQRSLIMKRGVLELMTAFIRFTHVQRL